MRVRIWSSVAIALLLVVTACSSSKDDGTKAAGGASTTASAGTVQRSKAVSAGRPDPSPGCGKSTVRTLKQQRRTIDVAGASRWYLLSVPPAHNGRTPLPLVVEFHGLAEGAQIAAMTSKFDELGAKDGFVTAFPNGTGAPVKWDASLDSKPNRDFEFVRDLLDTLGRNLCIDRSRVYATGLSYGAIISSSLACVMTDRFAAIAPVSGIQFPDGCKPSRRIPILAFHGTADPILFFNGGVGDLGAALSGGSATPTTVPAVDLTGKGYPATVAKWAAQNGCGSKATDTHVTAHVIRRTYHCPSGADVVFMIVEGGGHSWPGSAFSASIAKITGPTTKEIDATREIWRFFQRYSLPTSS